MNSVTVNNLEWKYDDRGSGDVILFVHGFPLDHSMWQGQLEDLSGDFRVIAPDLVGFGGSDAVEGTLGMDRLADDLATLLDRLEIDTPVAFCGLSMGGYVGWQMWQRHPGRISRLIQCDTRAIADSPEVARGRQMMAANLVQGSASVADLAAGLIPKLFADSTIQKKSPVVDATKSVIMKCPPQTVAAAQLGMAGREDFSDRLASIQTPCLLVCGEHDVISPAEEMKGIAAAMPKAEYVEIAGAGHMAPLEDSATFNGHLREYLTNH